jgi:hypothetical protein
MREEQRKKGKEREGNKKVMTLPKTCSRVNLLHTFTRVCYLKKEARGPV